MSPQSRVSSARRPSRRRGEAEPAIVLWDSLVSDVHWWRLCAVRDLAAAVPSWCARGGAGAQTRGAVDERRGPAARVFAGRGAGIRRAHRRGTRRGWRSARPGAHGRLDGRGIGARGPHRRAPRGRLAGADAALALGVLVWPDAARAAAATVRRWENTRSAATTRCAAGRLAARPLAPGRERTGGRHRRPPRHRDGIAHRRGEAAHVARSTRACDWPAHARRPRAERAPAPARGVPGHVGVPRARHLLDAVAELAEPPRTVGTARFTVGWRSNQGDGSPWAHDSWAINLATLLGFDLLDLAHGHRHA